jgi:hypothetical protein
MFVASTFSRPAIVEFHFLKCLSPDNVRYKLFLNVSDYLPVDMAIPEDLNSLVSIRFKKMI